MVVAEVAKLDLDLRWREHGRAHELLRGSRERMSCCLRESPYAHELPKRITLPEPGARLTEPGSRPKPWPKVALRVPKGG